MDGWDKSYFFLLFTIIISVSLLRNHPCYFLQGDDESLTNMSHYPVDVYVSSPQHHEAIHMDSLTGMCISFKSLHDVRATFVLETYLCGIV